MGGRLRRCMLGAPSVPANLALQLTSAAGTCNPPSVFRQPAPRNVSSVMASSSAPGLSSWAPLKGRNHFVIQAGSIPHKEAPAADVSSCQSQHVPSTEGADGCKDDGIDDAITRKHRLPDEVLSSVAVGNLTNEEEPPPPRVQSLSSPPPETLLQQWFLQSREDPTSQGDHATFSASRRGDDEMNVFSLFSSPPRFSSFLSPPTNPAIWPSRVPLHQSPAGSKPMASAELHLTNSTPEHAFANSTKSSSSPSQVDTHDVLAGLSPTSPPHGEPATSHSEPLLDTDEHPSLEQAPCSPTAQVPPLGYFLALGGERTGDSADKHDRGLYEENEDVGHFMGTEAMLNSLIISPPRGFLSPQKRSRLPFSSP
eukprot:TRINITY_DN35565_c0_g1_i1.p1 TRINITY_DN35565_c0_g1~~TRINITY_DN35565_c0_g1_i1.p1  ORF type:complete len:381 (-),score=48.46 TRINITY_DN35565_c0_g1_i1:659-1762(-)